MELIQHIQDDGAVSETVEIQDKPFVLAEKIESQVNILVFMRYSSSISEIRVVICEILLCYRRCNNDSVILFFNLKLASLRLSTICSFEM